MYLELNTQVPTAPPRAAATVVMLRDSAQGLEVFLVRRHGLSDVLGGAWVFPGGKVDASDAELDATQHLDQPLEDLHSQLGESDLSLDEAVGLYVAAVREAFEECGVLFSPGADPAAAMAWLREGRSFAEVLELLRLRLDTQALVPWSRWITPRVPSVSSKRFDTRFFVATVPAGQAATHDNREATESLWLPPRAALERYWANTLPLAPPQIMSLAHLSHFASTADVLQAARSRRPPVIQPEPYQLDDGRLICYPGDPQHPVAERALPGPTRLYYRNKRFEADGGLDAFFND